MSKVAWVALVVVGLVLVLVFALPMIVPLTSRHMYGYGYRGMMGPGMMGGFGIIGPVLTSLFVVLLVAGIVWLIQSMGKPGTQPPPPASETPLDILNRRYASGEITKKQYQEMKRDLGL
jgi:putative membrane protein